MKRFVKFLLSFILVFMLLAPMTAFAVEVTVEGEEIDYNTIFTRVWEFVVENKTEVVSAVGSGLVLAVNAIIKSANSKENKKLSKAFNALQEDAEIKNKVQTSIVDAVNQMISGYNVMKDSNDNLKIGYADMKEAYEINATREDDRNRLIGAVMVQNTAILEMFATIYVHNKNIPQGVKDLVILTYANTLKALDDDALLRSIVESVREKINFVEDADVAEEIVPADEPDATEV